MEGVDINCINVNGHGVHRGVEGGDINCIDMNGLRQ